QRATRGVVGELLPPAVLAPAAREPRSEHRQQDPDPALAQGVEQGARVRLVVGRDVGGHAAGVPDGFDAVLGEGRGVLLALPGRTSGAVRADGVAYGLLRVLQLETGRAGQAERRRHAPSVPRAHPPAREIGPGPDETDRTDTPRGAAA